MPPAGADAPTVGFQMYARSLLLQQQQQQQQQQQHHRHRTMMAQQQLLKGGAPLDMGAFALDGMRGNAGAGSQGPRGVPGKANVSCAACCTALLPRQCSM